jgi:hypothetical protein
MKKWISFFKNNSGLIDVLISHRKKFIYTKTKKTAGTSVELYFEKYCMPEGDWQFSHAREETISSHGIIGYRGNDSKHKTWWNHMPAAEIKTKGGPVLWETYFKFCVIRNPFEKLVSGYYFFHKQNPGKADANTRMAVIQRFRHWLKQGGIVMDRDTYVIDDKICIDYFIKYESLNNGIRHVCDTLGIPFEPERIPALKTGVRDKSIPIRDFYDKDSVEMVKNIYAFELDFFNYDYF